MNPRHDGGTGWMFLGLAIATMAVMGGLLGVTGIIGPAAIPIWGVTMVAAILIMRGPVGKAIAARLHGAAEPSDAALDVPEEVYAELDDLRARMLEMEERQDFAERLLARRSESAAIESGGQHE